MLTIFRRRGAKAAADQDAARMIREFGEQAFSAAGEMSWREDAGLLPTRNAGHWHRVQQEIGRRQARTSIDMPSIHMMADRALKEQLAGLQ